MKRPILVVDDDRAVRFTIRCLLEDAGHAVVEAGDGLEGLRKLEECGAALVISDLRMPGMDGLALLDAITKRPDPPRFILVTAHGSERQAVAAMKAGAWDYFRKPFEVDELLAVVSRAMETERLRAENERLSGELALSRTMVFRSAAMGRLATLVQRLASRDVTVLITGETGTGKERLAEAIVRASTRAERPFLCFNCASLSGELAEAELFGHVKGAFTGAHRDRPGLFREANGGTLLLDEIGELSAAAQAKLLRVLQEGEVRPVGESRAVKVDVRILAATHRDLKLLSETGQFRSDLYYRLKVVELHLPPLRERPEDIPLLARHFLVRYAARFGLRLPVLSPVLEARLSAWSWPGNVRELENNIEMMVALSADGSLDASLAPGGTAGGAEGTGVLDLKARVDAYERGLVVDALSRARNNRSEAARLLGMSRVTLYDKLKKYGLEEGG